MSGPSITYTQLSPGRYRVVLDGEIIGQVRKDVRRNLWSGWLSITKSSTADVVAATRRDATEDLVQMHRSRA